MSKTLCEIFGEEARQERKSRAMTTIERIKEKVGCPVSDLKILHFSTDPHQWIVGFVFDWYSVPVWASGMGDTRKEAIEDAIRCAEQRKH